MLKKIKKNLLFRLARLSRRYKLYRFDWIWRRLLNPDKNSKAHIDQILLIENKFWHINTHSYLEWTLFFYGTYEAQLQQLFKLYLTPGDTVIDVGGNIGIHTIYMASLVGKSGSVIGFEPQQEVYARLLQNLTLNQINNVTPLKIGLSNKNGSAYLQKFDINTSSNQGTSKIVSAQTGHETRILISRLDDIIASYLNSPDQKIKLIKVDIEGHEDAFFEGAAQTIKNHNPIIIFEDSEKFLHNKKSAMRSVLDSNNYTFFGIEFDSLHHIAIEEISQSRYYRILALPAVINREKKGD